ncbi:MAG: 30S ribosomal protein S21 [Fidelibacterota bacterium]
MAKLVQVTVRKGEDLNRALKRFKKKYEKAGILRDIRRKSFYLKPSAARRMRNGKPRR